MIASITLLVLAGCQSSTAGASKPAVAVSSDPLAKRVLVIINRNSADSLAIGRYYVQKRLIPSTNVLEISTGTEEETTRDTFGVDVEPALRSKLSGLRGKIDYIVLTKGFPLRFGEGRGVDAYISVMELGKDRRDAIMNAQIKQMISPYVGKEEPFSREKYGFYLVTRLDGYTATDAKALVDRSLAAKGGLGPFVFDYAANRTTEGYGQLQGKYAPAIDQLKNRGFGVISDSDKTMVVPTQPLMGYLGWGSNDGGFKLDEYRKLKFKPGAIAETFVSTSGRTFRPTSGGQSLIADLVAQGVTGVKGYVSEPFLYSMAQPEILFDRYTKGYTLAESFYMASPILGNRDVIIGDPICHPYPSNR